MAFNRSLGKSFKKVGESYNLGRRDYPKKLIKDIIKISKTGKNSSILDIGCGTGKSTLPFAKIGCKITGIDISENMLRVARRYSSKYKNIIYRKSSFEKIKLLPDSFTLILVGTALHWLDPKIAYKKANLILKSGGYIAAFWEPIAYLQSLPLEIKEILTRNCPNFPKNPDTNKSIMRIKKRLTRYNYFFKPILKRYPSIQIYNPEEFLNLIKSYSWVISLNKKKKEQVVKEISLYLDKRNKPVKLSEEYCLIIAKK